MRKQSVLLVLTIVVFISVGVKWAISDDAKSERERRALVDTRVDNNGYWKKMAKKGLSVLNPEVEVPAAIFTGSKIIASAVREDDSPDVPVTEVNSTQSENSIFVDPNNNETVLNSNNSTQNPVGSLYGANDFFSFDAGGTWGGEVYGAGGNNSGDPATCIGTDGRWYVGYIASGGGQGVSYSDDQGNTWTKKTVTTSSSDKNHLWIDNKVGSPHENYLYDSWVEFSGSNSNDIVVQRSIDNGESWESKINISNEVNAGSHNQGVNLSTGPNGEVYAVWAVYDGWPQDEKAIGYAKSLNGGETWEPSIRIIDNIRGIRNSEVPQNMRCNSFPTAAVDCSNGASSGNIYVVWTNIGVPGVNTGNDRDIYLIKSTDDGNNWSEPIRVNQDEIGQGKAHYFPWIAVDPSNGIISIVFYDNRNTSANQAEAWVAVSADEGETWEDFKVSDVSFTPSPIPGLAGGYFGDYLGITALDGKVYPCWTDNRSGHAMTYVSPFETLIIPPPLNLQASVDQETGSCLLEWEYEEGELVLEEFRVYRDDELIGTTTELTFNDVLTEYGYYTYTTTAYYGDDIVSNATLVNTQYGSSKISVIPEQVVANVNVDLTVAKSMYVKNIGVLDLDFSLFPFFNKNNETQYQKASGGGDEYIKNVMFEQINNSSASDFYSDFTSLYTTLESGNAYFIKVLNGNAYNGDQCKVWIDWNSDGEFNENAISLSADITSKEFSGKIMVPKGSAQGLTRMRVRLSGPGKLTAYGNTEYGETEDYAILLADWLTMDPEEGIVAVDDSLNVVLTFDAAGMTIGTYDYTLRLITNDLENGLFAVPITMNITDLQVTASADLTIVCEEEEVQLSAVGFGGTGSYTYEWSSIPEGFISTDQNPIANPEISTRFIVAINDGELVMTDSININVLETPDVNLGSDTTLCDINEYFMDAGNPGASYLWSTGETTQTVTVNGEGSNAYWVEVTNENECTATDTLIVDFATSPVVELGADTIICHNSTLILDAGNQGATYLWSTGETDQTISVVGEDYEFGNHVFSVQVSTPGGCENEGGITVEIKDCTSIDENRQLVNINVFPNPNSGAFNVQLNSKKLQSVSLQIMNLSGMIVYELESLEIKDSHSIQIDLSNLANGVYGIFVNGENGTVEKKVILQK